ncbi:MAG: hypothetical protein KKH01_08690 [Firmicutes bacterium]|nr:hypothetical protein [Bacillota bacterium]
MWFLWGLLMWFGCHTALNLCLSFSRKYKDSNYGMDLYVAIGAGVACVGATIFAFSYLDKEIALFIGGAIGFLTGGWHFNLNKKVETLKSTLAKDEFLQSNRTKYDEVDDDETLSGLAEEMERAKNDPVLKELMSQFGGMSGKQIFGKNFIMDEKEFEKVQKQHPWTMQSSITFANKQRSGKDCQLDFWESLSMISCFIFGAMGFEKDLDKAEQMLKHLIPPQAPHEQIMFITAHTNILRGTIYVYKKEYVKACYYLISGLKLGTNLSTPYCDFIRYIIDKILKLPNQKAKYTGVGYSAKQYMGSTTEVNQGEYDIWATMQIVPCLEGDNGEVVLAHQGSSGLYGYLEKRGEENGIDIYETYIIDINFNLKTIKFYCNNYFLSKEPKPINIPNGFHINKDYAPNIQGSIIGSNGQFIVK